MERSKRRKEVKATDRKTRATERTVKATDRKGEATDGMIKAAERSQSDG
ncbi:hypothetical protein [Lysinibacillus sp. JNUCC 51]|nr:hypothetical protein JNUCC51_12045 [Lysinibacillus sp. JNUCC-51]